MKRTLLLAIALVPFVAGAQQATTTPTEKVELTTVSVQATGTDVKTVLHNLFAQAKKNYVIQPNTFFALHLELNNIDFDEALAIVCKTASLKYKIQNGIYFIFRANANDLAGVAVAGGSAQKIVNLQPAKRTLPQSVLWKHVNAKLHRAPIQSVFAELTKQTGVPFEIDKSVPNYKLDATLRKVTLKFALTTISHATGLNYQFTDRATIKIFAVTEPQNAVSVSKD